MSRMFSGFRSQCTMRSCRISARHWSVWLVNRRIRWVLNPSKLFALISSYRLMLSSSIATHRWFRKVNDSTMRTTLCSAFGSARTSCSMIFTSTSAWWWKRRLFRMSFTATCCPVLWSLHCSTWPNEPRPSSLVIS